MLHWAYPPKCPKCAAPFCRVNANTVVCHTRDCKLYGEHIALPWWRWFLLGLRDRGTQRPSSK